MSLCISLYKEHERLSHLIRNSGVITFSGKSDGRESHTPADIYLNGPEQMMHYIVQHSTESEGSQMFQTPVHMVILVYLYFEAFRQKKSSRTTDSIPDLGDLGR